MNKKRFWLNLLLLAFLLFLLVGDILVLIYFGHGSWNDRLSLILQIIGFYGIGIGFIQKSDSLKKIIQFDDLTSPEPAIFITGNLFFLAVFFSVFAVALVPERSRKGNLALGCLGQLIILCLLPFIFLYSLFHIIVIAPFAYIGYLFVSTLVESIAGSATDTEFTLTSPEKEQKTMRIKESIASNPAAAKSFLIGVPAIVISLIVKGIGIFLQG